MGQFEWNTLGRQRLEAEGSKGYRGVGRVSKPKLEARAANTSHTAQILHTVLDRGRHTKPALATCRGWAHALLRELHTELPPPLSPVNPCRINIPI